jgi:hypothetical protein
MGCWNGTCGISRLPIRAGDPVYGMIITKSQYTMDCSTPRGHNTSGMCYITDGYYPIAPMFSGRYDDYGCIEQFPKKEEVLRTTIHNHLKGMVLSSEEIQKLSGNEDEMAEYDGSPKDISEKGFLEFINVMERERVFWDCRGVAVPMGLWMAHRWAVDAFVDKDKLAEDVATAKVNAGRVTYRDCIEAINALRDEYDNDLENEDYKAKLKVHKDAILTALEDGGPIPRPGVFSNWPHQRFKLPLGGKAVSVRMNSRTTQMLSAMMEMRMAVAPQAGKGSQGDMVRAHKTLATAILKNARKSWDDDYEERKAARELAKADE